MRERRAFPSARDSTLPTTRSRESKLRGGVQTSGRCNSSRSFSPVVYLSPPVGGIAYASVMRNRNSAWRSEHPTGVTGGEWHLASYFRIMLGSYVRQWRNPYMPRARVIHDTGILMQRARARAHASRPTERLEEFEGSFSRDVKRRNIFAWTARRNNAGSRGDVARHI